MRNTTAATDLVQVKPLKIQNCITGVMQRWRKQKRAGRQAGKASRRFVSRAVVGTKQRKGRMYRPFKWAAVRIDNSRVNTGPKNESNGYLVNPSY